MTAFGVVLNPVEKNWYQYDFDDMENFGQVAFTGAQVVFYPDGHSCVPPIRRLP